MSLISCMKFSSSKKMQRKCYETITEKISKRDFFNFQGLKEIFGVDP